MEPIDVTPIISQFEEHIKVNNRTIFSAHFGDGKTWFLNKFIEARSDQYEFIAFVRDHTQHLPSIPGVGGTSGIPLFLHRPGRPGFSGIPGRPGYGGWSDTLLEDYLEDNE